MSIKSKHFIGAILALGLIIAGVFCVTFATLTQAVPLLLFASVSVFVVIQSRKEIYQGNNRLKVFTLFTVGYFMLRAYFSPVPDLARQDIFLIASGGMMYIILGILVPSKVIRNWITIAFITVMLLNLLNWIPAVDQRHDGILNYATGSLNTGWFHHRNFFGNFMFIMSCLCMSLGLLGEGKSHLFRFGLLALAICGGVSVILSTSRASFLALTIGGGVVLACYFLVRGVTASKKQKSMYVIFGLGLALLMSVVLIIGGKYVLSERSTEMGDANGRNDYFSISLEQVPDAPMIGSGSRSVEYKSYEYWPFEMRNDNTDFRFVHNEYLQAVTDYGVIGLLLLLGVFIWHIINGLMLLYVRVFEKETAELAYVVAGLSIMIGFSVNILFSFPMHGFVNLMLIVFAATMLQGKISKKAENKNDEKTCGGFMLRPLSFLMLSGILVYSFTFGVKELMAGTVFWKNKIVADDLFWKLDEHDGEQWEEVLKQSVQFSPSYTRYNYLGEIYFSKNKYDEAIKFYELSKERHPFSPTSRISLARLWIKKEQYAKAEIEFKEVEYLVQNREPLFHYYRDLAEFYTGWAIVEPERRTELLSKARNACDLSVKKYNGYINRELRHTISRVLLTSYEHQMELKNYDIADQLFDEFTLVSRRIPVSTPEEIENILIHAISILKYADYSWNSGVMDRAAKFTYRAKECYLRYKRFKKGEVEQSWINQMKQIEAALSMFKQAGIKIDKK